MAIEKEILDQLLAGRDPGDLFGKDGLVNELKKALSERILNIELDKHLGEEAAVGCGSHRNGSLKKSMPEPFPFKWNHLNDKNVR